MAASYPIATKAFTTKLTGDTVQAAHVDDLQDEVTAIENALLTGLAHALIVGGTLSVTGVVSVTGVGTHAFSAAGGNTFNALNVRNTNAGTAAAAYISVGTDVTQDQGFLEAFSSTFTTSTFKVASGVALVSNSAGGLSIAALDPAGDIRFYTGSGGGAVLRSQLTDTGLLEHNSGFALSGIVSPAQITANQNDYAPTDFATASWLRLSSDAARDITGFAGGAQGRLIALSNQGSFTITLKHNSGSSTAGNRILCPGAVDFALTTFQTRWIYYDATAAAWVVIGA